MMTAISGSRVSAQPRNSTPFMRGSSISSRQMSKRSEFSQLSASSAEAATRTEYPNRVMSRCRPRRTSTSSSTTRTRPRSGAAARTSFQPIRLLNVYAPSVGSASVPLVLHVFHFPEFQKGPVDLAGNVDVRCPPRLLGSGDLFRGGVTPHAQDPPKGQCETSREHHAQDGTPGPRPTGHPERPRSDACFDLPDALELRRMRPFVRVPFPPGATGPASFDPAFHRGSLRRILVRGDPWVASTVCKLIAPWSRGNYTVLARPAHFLEHR